MPKGVSTAKFLPDGDDPRAARHVILWRAGGEPRACLRGGFPATSRMARGMPWPSAGRRAVVVKGYDNGCFGPNDAVTREQMVTILYRHAQYKGLLCDIGEDTNIQSFRTYFRYIHQWAFVCERHRRRNVPHPDTTTPTIAT